jgi:hypothetical protein
MVEYRRKQFATGAVHIILARPRPFLANTPCRVTRRSSWHNPHRRSDLHKFFVEGAAISEYYSLLDERLGG